MPQKKQPSQLRRICIKALANIVEDASVAIGSRTNYHFDENNMEAEREIRDLREYFIYNTGHTYEDICLEIYKFSQKRLSEIKFPTIVVNLLFHTHTKIVPLLWYFQGMPMNVHTAFWERSLSVLRNITLLKISNIACSDQMLRTISTNCQILEILYFSSKSIAVTKLGLQHIATISSLLVVHDIHNFLKFSNNDVRTLLVNLSNLVGFNYEHIGSLLCRTPNLKPLRLRYVAERDLKVKHIVAIANVCPNIERLLIGKSADNYEDPLITLAESDINVKKLQVIGPNGIYFNDMLPLLRAKGMHLTCLHIWRQDQWYITDVREIVLIGVSCPFLEEVLFGMDINPVHDIGVTPTKPYVMSESEEKEIFRHLLKLKIVGGMDFNCGIVQLCLRNAKKITDVILKSYDEEGLNLQEIFESVLETNRMTELRQFVLYGQHVFLDDVNSVKGLFRLQNIRSLNVSAILSVGVVSFFRQMEHIIRDTNLNLRLVWVDLGNAFSLLEEEGSSNSADDLGGSDNEDSADELHTDEENSDQEDHNEDYYGAIEVNVAALEAERMRFLTLSLKACLTSVLLSVCGSILSHVYSNFWGRD